MPVQELKLDRSFVASVLQSAPDEAVVRSTVSLAQSLGIRTLADGVDTGELLGRVRSFGVPGVSRERRSATRCPRRCWADWLGTAMPELESPRTPHADRMTAVADQPVRAAGRGRQEPARAATRPGPAPKTTPISLPDGTALDRAAGWNRASLVPGLARPGHPLVPGVRRNRASLVPGAWNRASLVPGAWNRASLVLGAGRNRTAPAPARAPGWGWATGRDRRSWTTSGAPAVHRPAARAAAVRDKLREWGRRYLLAEIAGTVAAVSAALAVHTVTGSLASAALAGSVAESLAYYGVILRRMLPIIWARHAGPGPVRRLVRTGRDVLTEASDFLVAELADTLAVRPGLIYLAAGWAGWARHGTGPADRQAARRRRLLRRRHPLVRAAKKLMHR